MAPPFEEVDLSDPDSISITSTRSSDEEAEYDVEKINAEEWDPNEGVMKYLVKWEGYQLHLSTWEPAANFLADQILQEWEREKAAVSAGLQQPFDLDAFYEIQETHIEEKEARQQRRAAKRRRLGMASRNGSISNGSTNNVATRDPVNDSEDSGDDQPLRRKRLNTTVPARKGVAQKVKKSQNRMTAAAVSSSEHSSEAESETSKDSLLEEARNAVLSKARPGAASPASRANSNAATSTTNMKTKATAKRTTAQSANASPKCAVSSTDSRPAGSGNRTTVSSAARKSAPSTASLPSANAPKRLPVLPTDAPTEKSSSSALVTSFLSSSTAGPSRKQRKMSESDSRHMRYKNLSEQERFRKHEQKEGVPDPNVLGTFNPATGRFDKPAVTAASAVPEPLRKTSLPAVLVRQPGSPQQTRRTSLGPLGTQPPRKPPAASMVPTQNPVVRSSACESMGEAPRAPRAKDNPSTVPSIFGRREAPAPARPRSVSPPSSVDRTSTDAIPDYRRAPTKVCWDWRNGQCNKPPGSCTFAHYYRMCPFWKNGNCKYEEKDCKYDHQENDPDVIVPELHRTGRLEPDVDTHMDISSPQNVDRMDNAPTKNHQTPNNKVCWYWRATGKCEKPPGVCTYAHHYIICPFWRAGTCKNSEKECKFDHRADGIDAAMPESRKTRDVGLDDGARGSISSPPKVERTTIIPMDANHKAPTKVCYFYKNGRRCTKPPGVCTFAHYHIVCEKWKAGKCQFDENDCPNFHIDDGLGATLPAPPKVKGSGFVGDAQETMSSDHDEPEEPASTGPLSAATAVRLEDTTCRDWASGRCHRGGNCFQAHYQTAHVICLKEDVMCRFWVQGHCFKSDSQCKFAHRQTQYTSCSQWSSKVLYTPATGSGSNTANQHTLHHDGAKQSSAHRPLVMSPGEIHDEYQMIVDNESAQPTVASPVEMGAISKLPSLSMHTSHGSPASMYDVVLDIQCGPDEFDAAVKLACPTLPDISQVVDLMGAQSRLQLRRMVDSADFKHHFADSMKQGASLPAGDVIYPATSDSRMEKMLETYRRHTSCGVVQSPRFTLLVYPAGVEEWNFLATPGDMTSSQAALKFKLLPPLPQEARVTDEVASSAIFDGASSASSALAAKQLLDSDLERLLTISDVKMEVNVFVMAPPSRLTEMRVIAATFEDRFKQPDYKDRETRVWTSEHPGAWDDCLKNAQDTCLLLIHPEVPLWDVPNLGRLLHYPVFRVFSLGVGPALVALVQHHPEPGCQRLFPMGDVVFVTDDVFTQTPEKVLRIIDEINRGNKGKPVGATRNRIVTRSGVRMWLMDLVTEKTGDRGREDPRWLRLLEAIWDLCPADKDDEYYPGNPSEEKSDLVSIPPEQLPTFEELSKTDQSRATDYIINWFAGWSYQNASKFRRFTVCHEEPNTGKPDLDENYNVVMRGGQADPKGWANKYQYLLVQTPDQWLKDKGKAAKAKAAAVSKK